MVLNVMEAQKSHFVGKIELNNQNISELQEELSVHMDQTSRNRTRIRIRCCDSLRRLEALLLWLVEVGGCGLTIRIVRRIDNDQEYDEEDYGDVDEKHVDDDDFYKACYC